MSLLAATHVLVGSDRYRRPQALVAVMLVPKPKGGLAHAR